MIFGSGHNVAATGPGLRHGGGSHLAGENETKRWCGLALIVLE
jgi:hypothetical protein